MWLKTFCYTIAGLRSVTIVSAVIGYIRVLKAHSTESKGPTRIENFLIRFSRADSLRKQKYVSKICSLIRNTLIRIMSCLFLFIVDCLIGFVCLIEEGGRMRTKKKLKATRIVEHICEYEQKHANYRV
jgi:hypothetical protein